MAKKKKPSIKEAFSFTSAPKISVEEFLKQNQ
jgi:hypothetical protein